jgi:hypothetical protein
MVYAELRKEDGGDGTHYTMRYLVWNDNNLGTYGVHYGRSGAYGASRDHHTLVTDEQAKVYERWSKLSTDEQYEDENYLPYGGCYNECCYHDGKLSICDGSGLVEITEDERKAFAIAAMMADVDKETT